MQPFNAIAETRHGPMIHNANDVHVGRSLALYGEFSEIESRFLRSWLNPGDICIDVGANVGAHAVPLARHVGKAGVVLAFEPQRLAFQALAGNVAINNLSNVVTFWAAAGAAAGDILVPMLDPWKPQNIGSLSLGAWTDGERVPVVALGFLRLDRCRLIKIDAEGMENEVLAGAEALIDRCRPVLYLENDRRDRSPELLNRLFRSGYRAWWHLPPYFNPDNFRARTDNIFGGGISINLVALPVGVPPPPGLREAASPDDWWE